MPMVVHSVIAHHELAKDPPSGCYGNLNFRVVLHER
jgi:hypothetical protein